MLQDPSPQSPEQRTLHRLERDSDAEVHQLGGLPLPARLREVARRVVVGVFSDGFIHAGNLAYLTLLTLFPFFIVTAALASLLGRNDDTILAVNSVLVGLPPSVQLVLRQPIHDVLTERTGGLLWLGGIVGLWTVGSFIETIRDILRRSYGVQSSAPFWHYRLSSMGLIIGAVIIMMLAFAVQVFLTAIEQFVFRIFPFAHDAVSWIQLGRLVPLMVAWGAIYLLMWALTPGKYRVFKCPKWPGALFVALWWFGALAILPVVIARVSNYNLTYGTLSGVIVSLVFFWFVGLGFVIGAHLNAALAETPDRALEAGAEE